MNILRAPLIVLIALAASSPLAVERGSFSSIPYWDCFARAAEEYSLNPLLLAAIAEQESSFNSSAINTNNGRAVGLMQIHSWWFPKLSVYGISEKDLYNACTNVAVGAWIFSQKTARYGNTWKAVGSYFAGTGTTKETNELRINYAASVSRRYQRLAGRL
ncbi:lytic transglycosylase domain-containing protein [uncultured Microbulbifer sp.]|uniref:lytic transglycosylase domain-containing protein n=1 Tax=uncultured Microbulbifer sp. TaxID=348147 RepID=UPI0026033C86|nr:lytic transglycosylase domain-containing protein [uncultured Microbulbifer sp.]